MLWRHGARNPQMSQKYADGTRGGEGEPCAGAGFPRPWRAEGRGTKSARLSVPSVCSVVIGHHAQALKRLLRTLRAALRSPGNVI